MCIWSISISWSGTENKGQTTAVEAGFGECFISQDLLKCCIPLLFPIKRGSDALLPPMRFKKTFLFSLLHT